MLIFRIIGLGVVAAALSVLVKQHRPELAMAIPILASVLILSMCAPYLAAVIELIEDIADRSGIELTHIKTVIKITGVAYICQFASDICKDAGESAVSSKIELGGKIVIITLSMPIIYNLLELASSIINF